MTAKQKAAPGVTSTESGKEEREAALAGGASDSFKTQFTTCGGVIASVLSEGRGNALTGREIKRLLDLKDGRDVTAIVERERRGGVPICATTNSEKPGYFLPETPEELAAYNRSLRRRIKNIAQTLDAMEKSLDDWTGQQRLDLPGGDTD